MGRTLPPRVAWVIAGGVAYVHALGGCEVLLDTANLRELSPADDAGMDSTTSSSGSGSGGSASGSSSSGSSSASGGSSSSSSSSASSSGGSTSSGSSSSSTSSSGSSSSSGGSSSSTGDDAGEDAGEDASTCTSTCSQGQTTCVSDSLATCALGNNGCWYYGAAVACPSAYQSCTGSPGSAACTCNASSVCTSAAAACADSTTIANCAQDSYGCFYEAAMTTCASGTACRGAACVPFCTRAANCPSGESCDASTGACTTLCSGTQPCNGGCCSAGACVTNCPVSVSTGGYVCPVGEMGAAGACESGGNTATCSTSTPCWCVSNSQCESGECLTWGGCVGGTGTSGTQCVTAAPAGDNVDDYNCVLASPGIPTTPATSSLVCTTTLTPTPVSNSGGTACLCVADSDCNSGMCVNANSQCTGTCSGSTSDTLDQADCQLLTAVSSSAASCLTGNCDNVTSPTGTCSAAGVPCWCTNDDQCGEGLCVNWAGCASGACTGSSGTPDGFNCVP
jgi:hypothetical protein